MKQPPEPLPPPLLCETWYKCGCVWRGVFEERPQLCPLHSQPEKTSVFLTRPREDEDA